MALFTLQYQLEQERNLRPFKQDVIQKLPKGRSGLYALWLPGDIEGADDCLYVGMSEVCLRQRLLQHLTNEANPGLRLKLRMFSDMVLFSLSYIERVEQIRELEAELIQAWQPETNRNLLS